MGGGSSDAAALLRALNSLFSANVPQKVLVEIAEKIGSDVPFFLYGDCAIVSGRGEIVRPIEGRRDLYFVVICPDVHSSTKEAYGLVDEWNMNNTVSKVEWPSLDELEGIYKRPADKWVFANSLTKPLISRYPEIQRALDAITDVGADFADMTTICLYDNYLFVFCDKLSITFGGFFFLNYVIIYFFLILLLS